jgi:hypothetical protein
MDERMAGKSARVNAAGWQEDQWQENERKGAEPQSLSEK